MLGQFITRLRHNKKLTMRELAEKTNLSSSYISRIEHDQSTVSLETLEKLADVLGNRKEMFCFAQKIPPELKETVFTPEVIEFLQDLSTLKREERLNILNKRRMTCRKKKKN